MGELEEREYIILETIRLENWLDMINKNELNMTPSVGHLMDDDTCHQEKKYRKKCEFDCFRGI